MTLAHYQFSVHHEIRPSTFPVTFLVGIIDGIVNRGRYATLKKNKIGCLMKKCILFFLCDSYIMQYEFYTGP